MTRLLVLLFIPTKYESDALITLKKGKPKGQPGTTPNTNARRPIMKTCLYNFDPFYIVKLGFTEVYIIFLIFAQKHRLWVFVTEAVLMSSHNLCFEQKYENYQNFLSENFLYLEVKFSIYLNRHVLVMCSPDSTILKDGFF